MGKSSKKDLVFNEFKRRPTVRIPTGIILLDVLLNGGIPPGDYVEICSDSGLGKSTICLQIAKRYAVTQGWVLILDHEQGMTDELLESMSLLNLVNEEKVVILQPITYKDSETILDTLSEETLPSLVLIDSITAMLPDKDAVGIEDTSKSKTSKGKPKGKAIGVKARSEAEFMLKYKGWARKNGITFIFINQIRTKFTRSFIAYQDSAGGNAFKFYCDIRLFFRRVKDLTREEETFEGNKEVPYGNILEVVAKKNRGNRSHIPISIDVVFGKGVSNIKSMANVLISAGYVEQAGSYFKLEGLGEDKNVKGWSGLLEYVRDNKVVLREKINKIGTLLLTEGDSSG